MKMLIGPLGLLLVLAACGKTENTPQAGDSSAETASTAVADTRPREFQQCAVCHSDTKGARNKLGPNLFGVVGSKAGTEPRDFAYTEAMKSSGITWDRARLDAFIENPRGVVPGTRMVFVGQKDPAKRKAIIDYLETLH